MSKINLHYIGQNRDARAFVVENLVDAEKAPYLADSEVEHHLNKYIEENNLEIVYMDGGQDIFLIPFSVLEKSVSFHR